MKRTGIERRRRAVLLLCSAVAVSLMAPAATAQAATVSLFGIGGSTPPPRQASTATTAPATCPTTTSSPLLPATVPSTATVPGTAVHLDVANLGPAHSNLLTGAEGGYETTWEHYYSHSLRCGAPQALSSLGLGLVRCCQPVNVRYCASGDDCTYHFPNGLGQNSSALPIGPDQLMNVIETTTSGASPLLIVNIEKGSIQNAANFVAYMNVTAYPGDPRALVQGTPQWWAALRVKNGHPAPYGVHWWEIGNEEFDISNVQLSDYGNCMVNRSNGAKLYACLFKAYAQAMHTVDPSIELVANYSPFFVKPLLDAAGGQVAAFDYHAYSAKGDTYSITFDHDTQSADITVAPVASGLPRNVTYAFWLTGGDIHTNLPPVFNVYMDGSNSPMTTLKGDSILDQSKEASVSSNTSNSGLLVAQALTSAGTHTLHVSACANPSASSAPASRCSNMGRDFTLTLRKVTYTTDATNANPYSWFSQRRPSFGCFFSLPGTLVDTRVGTSTMPTATHPLVPWRNSSADYAMAVTAGFAQREDDYIQGTDYWDIRGSLNAYNAQTRTPWAGGIVIGEYSVFPGCDELPHEINNSQEGALGDALMHMSLLRGATASTFPIVGASLYAADTTNPTSTCRGWQTVHEANFCNGGFTGAYVGAQGNVMRMLWSLRGSYVPLTVNGPKVNVPSNSLQPAYVGAGALNQVQAIAYRDGNTLQVVLVNVSPTSPVSLPLDLGGALTTAGSAVTVAAAPETVNTDTNQTAVSTATLPVSIAGGVATVTLPAFSASLVTLTLG